MPRWKKGDPSPNPHGRIKGSGEQARHRQAIAEHVPGIIETLVFLAAHGDVPAAKLLLERVLAPLRPDSATIELPELEAAADWTGKTDAVLQAVSRGKIAPDVGAQLLASITNAARVAEIDEIDRRLTELEAKGLV